MATRLTEMVVLMQYGMSTHRIPYCLPINCFSKLMTSAGSKSPTATLADRTWCRHGTLAIHPADTLQHRHTLLPTDIQHATQAHGYLRTFTKQHKHTLLPTDVHQATQAHTATYRRSPSNTGTHCYLQTFTKQHRHTLLPTDIHQATPAHTANQVTLYVAYSRLQQILMQTCQCQDTW